MPAAAPDSPTPDVLIVGLGPVGATLAALLAADGVRVAVVEREVTPHALPRAAHLSDRSLDVLRRAGVADTVVAAGREIDGFELADRRGRSLLRARNAPAVPGLPTALLIHQPTVDAALRERLRTLGVPTHLGATVTGVRQDTGGATLSVHRGGRVSTLRAGLVVGADGARSTVRGAMGARLSGGGFRQRWLVVDVLVPPAVGDRLPTRLVQTADPQQPRTYVPFPGRRRRWEWRLRDDEADGQAEAPGAVRERLRTVLGADADAVDIERATVYTFYDLIADRWWRGRLLLAGDAAHLMPPFLGEGLGEGLRDADVLAPLVRAVLDGAPLATLGAYGAARQRAVRRTTRRAVALGRLITLPEPLATLRDAALRLGQRVPGLAPRLLGWTV